jgi:hypothetical protein
MTGRASTRSGGASRRGLALSSLMLAAGLAYSCNSNTGSKDTASLGGQNGVSDGDTVRTNIDGGPTEGVDLPSALNPFCGTTGELDCIPDNVPDNPHSSICSGSGNASGGQPGEDSSSGGAGGAAEGGAGGGGSGGETGSGGSPSSDGGSGGEGTGGMGGAPAVDAGGEVDASLGGASGNAELGEACRVVLSDGQPKRECAPAGTGELDAPCVASSDCASGLACVGDDLAGRCLPYCCLGDITCKPGTYCTELSLRDVTAVVPVCVAADRCKLGDPYPCPEDATCQCPADTACTVVRPDGTTSCVEPGEGMLGEECPCAPGFLCSTATGTCLKLCSTTGSSVDGGAFPAGDGCGSGKCQSAAQLPKGWGLCTVSGAPDAG